MPLLILAGVLVAVVVGTQWSRSEPDPKAGPQWNRPGGSRRR